MFTKLSGAWGVSSIEGFTVVRRGSPLTQFVIEYSEAGRSLRYALENLGPGSIQPIAVAAIGPWLPPHAHEVISPAQQHQIADRIVQAMFFLGDKFAVV
jgi:hypothetical protein